MHGPKNRSRLKRTAVCQNLEWYPRVAHTSQGTHRVPDCPSCAQVCPVPPRVSLRVARGSRRSKEVSAQVLSCATLQRRPWRDTPHPSQRVLRDTFGCSQRDTLIPVRASQEWACCGSSPSWAPPTTCVRGTWDFALTARGGIKRHTKNHLRQYVVVGSKRTVSGPALCPCEEPPLDDSPLGRGRQLH